MPRVEFLEKTAADLGTAMRHRCCVHAVNGRAPIVKKCANNYECGACEYDQMLDDMDGSARAETVRQTPASLAA
jgi:hypothetical protein